MNASCKPYEALLKAYEKALSTHQWNAVEPLIHESCAFVFSDGTFIGKAQARTAFESTFATILNEEYKIDRIEWVYVSDDIATCVYCFSWKGEIDGRNSEGYGRGTSVLVKDGEKWFISSEHLGPSPRS